MSSLQKNFFSDQCALETAQWAQQRATHEHQKVQIHSSSIIGCTQGKGGMCYGYYVVEISPF